MKKRYFLISLIFIFIFSLCGCNNKLSTKEKVDDFNYMYNVLKSNYPFFGVNKRVNGVDWLSKKNEYIKRIKASTTDDEFFTTLNGILGELNNKHTCMLDENQYLYLKSMYDADKKINKAWLDQLNSKKAIARYLGDKNDLNSSNVNNSSNSTQNNVIPNNYETKILDQGKTAYLSIKTLNPFNIDEDMKGIKPFLKGIANYKTLIIDIRGNGGGDSDYWGKNLVPMLISKPLTTKGYLVYRGSSFQEKFLKCRNGFGYQGIETVKNIDKEGLKNAPPELKKDFKYYMKYESTVTPKDSIGFKGKIYLLVDKDVYSSSEMFASFCKSTGFATIIGERTGGDGIAEDPILCTLPNSGYVFRFPQQLGLIADGTCNEEFKTEPDIKVSASKGSTLTNDEAVKKVLEITK